MNELAIHIEYLLLSHNCVIVPQLGAFRADNTPARWIDSENLYMPPIRNVHFNPLINVDKENILINSIAESIRNMRNGKPNKPRQRHRQPIKRLKTSKGKDRKPSALGRYLFTKPVIKIDNPNVSPLMTMFGLFDFGGRGWIRTIEAESSRFTVCPLWPLGNSPILNLSAAH